ncbi:hypothetical protein C1645_813618 [Glomus cerebriforme]|uniref:Uncharacterized protein n=1 Tax=Glomus cerebriforme TaxID=658196 RepID=A0A397TID6_9GLOM|nr:hypothetical protein C1645_813618 [Glomus cerebriforme]
MNNDGQRIKLNFRGYAQYHYCCTFNLKDEFIVINEFYNQSIYEYSVIIWIYSTRIKNNKWMYKGIYKIPKGHRKVNNFNPEVNCTINNHLDKIRANHL